MPAVIDWEGLVVAFESRSHRITHYFDRETGDVEQVLERNPARQAELAADARYLAVPKDEGERSRGDLEAYAGDCEDDACRRELAAALASEDFAQAYREILTRYPKEECRFFQFKERRALERAQAWLAAMGVPFEKPPSREHPGGRGRPERLQ